MQVYVIRLKGQLDAYWTDWFHGLTIIHQENGETLLSGPIADQAELYGVLTKVRNAGLSLLSVNLVEPVQNKRTF